MAGIVAFTPELQRLVDLDAPVEKIASGCVFTEGPVWNSREGSLTFSDIPGQTLYRWTEGGGQTVLRSPSGGANGNTLDRQGRLVTCEHANRRVSRTAADGSVETIASHFDGKRLNSPNDVIPCANGDLIFTDPPYGLRQPDGSFAPQEVLFNGVFRWSARDGSLRVLVDDFVRPNGLVLTADESRLYICDTQLHHVRVFDVAADGSLADGRVFADVSREDLIGRPDGMKIDSEGNLYVTANTPEGVWVYDPSGRHLGFIGVAESPANCAWGGQDWRTLFVTAQTSVYRLRMKVAGQRVIVD